MPPGHPTEQGQHAALGLSPAHRRPELFVSGECLAEGPRQTLQTILHEAVHALAPCPWGQGHLPGWQVPQQARVRRPRRRAGLGLAGGPAASPGDRLLRRPADRAGLADYADTLACLGAAIRLYRDTFRRLGLLGGQGEDGRQAGQDGDRQQPTGKAGERFKVACGGQPPRSFWIRAQQYTPRGRSPTESAARTSNLRTPPATKQVAMLERPCALRAGFSTGAGVGADEC
jgi:hypothetical protein